MRDEDYVDTLEICGKTINVYMDDPGQCYVLQWEDNGEEHLESCGTYNTEYEEYARMRFDQEYKINFYRSMGITLASDRYTVCKDTAKVLHKLLKHKLIWKLFFKGSGLPYSGRYEEDIFKMLYGSWNTRPENKKLVGEVTVGKCPFCGAGVNEDMKFCMNCGNKIEF